MLRILTTSIIVLAIAVAAQAAPMTYTVPYSGSINGTETLNIPKYTGPETLTKVTLKITATANGGSVTYTSTDTIGQTVTLAIGAQVTAAGPVSGADSQ